MSEDNTNEAVDKLCSASCGIAEVDAIKLKECVDCDLVRYCSDACQIEHKSHHEEEACKKRAAELRDEILFKQPKSTHLGDCPICMIPLQLDLSKAFITTCCSKTICRGCSHANDLRIEEGSLEHKCSFCRKPTPISEGECDKQRMKRVEANDPVAMRREGVKQNKKGVYRHAFEYFKKAAELGDVDAHYRLSLMYYYGHGVEKDRGKEMYHSKEAAIDGHPKARNNLGCHECDNGNTEKAVKHWIIAASQGHDESIKTLMRAFKSGMVGKNELAAALRAHQAAVDATKSP
eukprot:scaffold1583_cov123-Skeletonema_dohrnii-CCMP3373.AAC.3